ncbi:hypothetical protein ACT3TP_17895 [Glutamicibacter sp. AOP38-B1-38]
MNEINIDQFAPSANPALIMIDVQQTFDCAEHWGRRNNPEAE